LIVKNFLQKKSDSDLKRTW